jgi:hypothetical protein
MTARHDEVIMKGPLKAGILAYVKAYDNVTFAELCRDFGDRVTLSMPKGETRILELRRNYIIWVNLTDEATDAIMSLRDEGTIHMRPTTPLTYLLDGCVLTFPVVKAARDYKKPHWLPVTLRYGPDPKGKRV